MSQKVFCAHFFGCCIYVIIGGVGWAKVNRLLQIKKSVGLKPHRFQKESTMMLSLSFILLRYDRYLNPMDSL